jgi:hypothetical protein
MIRRLQRRLRYWLHSGERARLLREEMEFHLEMKAEELREDGMTESDARAPQGDILAIPRSNRKRRVAHGSRDG